MKLDNIRLLVTRFDDCFHFYRNQLGLRVTWGEPGGAYAAFELPGGGAIAIFRRDLMANAVGTTRLAPFAEAQDRFVVVLGVDDVDKAAAALEKAGVKLTTAPRDVPDWGIRTAHVRDPDGNLLELITPLPR